MDIPLQHVLVALFVVLLGGSTRVKTRHEGSLAPPALVAQLLRSRRARPDVLLLLGPCGAGKTALFSLLAHGTAHTHTTTSMVANAGPLRPPPGGRLRRPLTVVDCPGHGRLRGLLDVHAPRAAAFVLVLDARDGSFLPTAREAADILLYANEKSGRGARPPRLLVVLHKADRAGCVHSVEFVVKKLDEELPRLRASRGTLRSAGGSSREAAAGGAGGAGGGAGGKTGKAGRGAARAAEPWTLSNSGAVAKPCSSLKGDAAAVYAFVDTLR